MMRVLAVLAGFSLALAINLLLTMPVHGPLQAAMPVSAGSSDESSAGDGAHEIFDLLNGERRRAGLPALAWNDDLAAAAVRHSRLMAQRNELSHDMHGEPPLQRRLAAVPLDRSGENVAEAGSAKEAHQALMESPHHRANILSSGFNSVGIGVVLLDSRYWVTQDFADTIEKVSDAHAEDVIAAALARERAQAGLPPLRDADDRRVHDLACHMGHSGKVNTNSALKLPQALYALAYTTSNVNVLPDNAGSLVRARSASRVAAGACFAANSHYPSGTYWVLLVAFAGR